MSYLSSVITVNPESSLFETLRLMQEKSVKHIVITKKNKPLGIVTERDINRFLNDDKTTRALNEIPIKHVMQKNVISIMDGMEDHFEQCAARMVTFRIGSVVMTNEGGEISGIVTRTDISKSYANVFGGKYIVKDFMNPKVVTCRKSDHIKFVLGLMNRNEISRLVVTNNDGKTLGLVTTNTFLTHNDFFSKGKTRSRDYLIPLKKKQVTVGDLMKSNLVTIGEEEDLATAATNMIKNSISGIPVLDKKKNLVGIISKSDVVKAFSIVGPHKELKAKYQEVY